MTVTATLTYELLEARVRAWAATQSTMRAVIIVGSRVRHGADRWSDLDLVLFTTERQRYAADPDWLSGFGTLWLTYLDQAGGGEPEWFALYEGALKLDALLFQIGEHAMALDLAALLDLFPYQSVLARGIKVLFDAADPTGIPQQIAAKPFTPSLPPTQAAFDQLTNHFLIDATTTAKFIARGDLWRAQRWFAVMLRAHLLTMIEWHALGQIRERDVWYSGRFIEQWADERALNVLPQLFPSYDQHSMKEALLKSLELFRWLSQEAVARLGYQRQYPAAEQQVTAQVRMMLANVGQDEAS